MMPSGLASDITAVAGSTSRTPRGPAVNRIGYPLHPEADSMGASRPTTVACVVSSTGFPDASSRSSGIESAGSRPVWSGWLVGR